MSEFRDRLAELGVLVVVGIPLWFAVQRGEAWLMVAVGLVVTGVGVGINHRGWGVDHRNGTPNVLGRLSSQFWLPPVTWGFCLIGLGVLAQALSG